MSDTNSIAPDFKKGDGLVPAIIQDNVTRQVLMLGYMNEESYTKTIETGLVTFYSRSKERLWTKGETSGNVLQLHTMSVDCDKDTILVMASPTGPVCHTGADTCFGGIDEFGFLHRLESVIARRADDDDRASYTARLLQSGINKVAQKVGEEAVEVVIEAKDNDKPKFIAESADLLYHLLVLCRAKNVSLSEIEQELLGRHAPKAGS